MGFKNVPYSTIVCGQISETYDGSGITMNAPNNATFSTTFTSVQFASYGTPQGSCGGYSIGGCHAGSSVGVIQNRALGRTSFFVAPDNATFGDPCVGTYKRLYMQLVASGTQAVFVPVPVISSFTATPNPQTSGVDGIPRYNTTLNWSASNGTSATITSSAGETWNVTPNSGTLQITNLAQSVVGTNSPTFRSYVLTVYNELNEFDTENLTVTAYNDNTPSTFTVPNQNNVEPNSPILINVGQIQGIDMRTAIESLEGGCDFSVSGGSYSGSPTIQNNETLVIRTFSLGFNTDPNGLTNSKTCRIRVGTDEKTFTVTTRAPDVEETFNFANKDQNVPFPDIDTIDNTPSEYILSDQIPVDDIELAYPYGVEVKTDNPSVEIKINKSNGTTTGWINTRSL